MQRNEIASRLAKDLGKYDMQLQRRLKTDNKHRLPLLLEAVDRFESHANPDHLAALADVFTRRPNGQFDLPPVEKLAKKLRDAE